MTTFHLSYLRQKFILNLVFVELVLAPRSKGRKTRKYKTHMNPKIVLELIHTSN